MARKVFQHDELAIHMRDSHVDGPNKWKQYEDHGWMEEWHLTIHTKYHITNTLLPQGLRRYIPVEHDHTMDELLAWMKEGVS